MRVAIDHVAVVPMVLLPSCVASHCHVAVVATWWVLTLLLLSLLLVLLLC